MFVWVFQILSQFCPSPFAQYCFLQSFIFICIVKNYLPLPSPRGETFHPPIHVKSISTICMDDRNLLTAIMIDLHPEQGCLSPLCSWDFQCDFQQAFVGSPILQLPLFLPSLLSIFLARSINLLQYVLLLAVPIACPYHTSPWSYNFICYLRELLQTALYNTGFSKFPSHGAQHHCTSSIRRVLEKN